MLVLLVLQYNMSKFITPEDLLNSQVERFNNGNIKVS
jgi:hypothetical protein